VWVSKFLAELAARSRRTVFMLIAMAAELQDVGSRIWTLICDPFSLVGRLLALSLAIAAAFFWFRVVIPWALGW
jgi:hypothetical protein